ncbi:kinesin light chain [Corynascus novoguineensis]|uniref:Kinesin light chain n=1 Tax=Corynascus novoguineensis TaxID=1126955 RepID=A0AAN7D1U9_9PEZI|nr:kinesin light chain [Corynascus novoguineensis]
MPAGAVRLLALDGGGVRGLSSLMILRRLMVAVDPDAPPRPCDCFDMIGGTNTGGLIAIMLGRLRMTVDECIEAYTLLSDEVLEKSHRVNINGELLDRFDATKLEQVVKEILAARGLGEDALLEDRDSSCKVFVCAVSKETGDTVCLTSYRSPRSDNSDLLKSTKIWQACRATSATTTFFDPIAIGPVPEEFVNGSLSANNPVCTLWNQAQDVWGDQLQGNLQCIVSIGTGVPALVPVRDDLSGIWATYRELVTETEKTAEQFRRDKSDLDDEGRYYRFNVDHGLEEIGLEESKNREEIAAATQRYVESQAVFKQLQACAGAIARREYFGPYRTVFALHGAPTLNNFIDRQFDTDDLEPCLLPQFRSLQTERQIFVLYGLGGIGKTQLAADFARRHKASFSSIFWLDGSSEDNLRQSLAGYASNIPEGQIPDRSRDIVPASDDEADTVAQDVLNWLTRPDNTEWLLIFDNVDQDSNRCGKTGVYDIRRYIPDDHGSVLITTRLAQLAHLGASRRLEKVDEELGKAIFERWYGRVLALDETGQELLDLLDGLPLALAQAASYFRESELNATTYVQLYKQQWDKLTRSDSETSSPLVKYEQGSIGTTWTISFDAIRAQNENAANLLRLWALINNKDLWHGLLQKARDDGDKWPAWLIELASSEVKFLDAVQLLSRYSMIEAQDSMPGSYAMHPVVHRWASHILTRDKEEGFPRLAVVLIGKSVPSNTAMDYLVFRRRLLPHAERIFRWARQVYVDGDELEDTWTLNAIQHLGVLFEGQGRLGEAEAMYRRTLQGYDKALGPDHMLTVDTINKLGNVYRVQCRLEEAEAMYQRALQGYDKALVPDHTSTLGMVHDLGYIYADQGRLVEAEALYQRALQGRERVLGSNHTLTFETIQGIGNIYRAQHRLVDAERMFQRALQGKEKTLGPDHTSTLSAVHSLGNLYANQRRLLKAGAMYQRALQGYEKALGPDHSSTLITVHNLGNIYATQRRLDEAEQISTELRLSSRRPRRCISGPFLDTKWPKERIICCVG